MEVIWRSIQNATVASMGPIRLQSTSRCFSSIDPLLFRQRYSLRNKDPRTAGSAFSSSLLSFQSWFPIHSNQMLAATKAIRISATSVVRSVAFRCNG